MEDIRKLLPKDKFDLSTTEELMMLDDDEIEAIIPDLLIWIQDMNWPVAEPIAMILIVYRKLTEKYLLDLLKPEQKDDIWKYNIITQLLMKWSSKPYDPRITAEIIRIAEKPTKGEWQESVDEAAREYLETFVFPELADE
ncbi:MAG: DUF5071 domain-containing protein [Lachnospiraceae bacterium]|nr:DUF5071 domain-containing protein [Lachnospiraceae bacterium]